MRARLFLSPVILIPLNHGSITHRMNDQKKKEPKSHHQNSDRGSRKFRGIWIPSEIWEHPNLTLQQKVFLSEIDSLSGRSGCFASNAYFAKFFGLSKSRVSNVISSLEKAGLIHVEMITSDTGRNVEKRIIKPTGYDRPIVMKVAHEKPTEAKPEKNTDAIRRIVECLNHVAGTNYKPTAVTTKKHINARLNEGFTLDDFKIVIANRVRVWSNDDKMKQFIRPETLFGTKFESYLNNARIDTRVKKASSPVNFGEKSTDQ